MQIKTISDKAIAGMQTTQSERDFFNLNVFTLPEVRKTIDQADAVRIGQVETKIRIFNRDLADLLNKEPLKEFNKFRGHNTYKFRGHQIPGTPNSGDTILNCPTRTSPRNSQVSCP
jgi:hypothetical protein